MQQRRIHLYTGRTCNWLLVTLYLLLSVAFAETGDSTNANSLNIDPLDQAHARFLKLFNDGLYDQATVAASQTLEIARWTYGNNSLEAALAQTNLATVQSRKSDYEPAIKNYMSSIEIIEDSEGIVSPRLINPLMGLASAYNTTGAYDLGLLTYERTLRINHVELGLRNEQQMPIRDGLTESYVALGDLDKADFQQEVQTRIIRQEFGGNSEQALTSIYKLARWYERTNQLELEAYQYQAALRLIRENTDKESPAQIDALRNLAQVYQRAYMPAESMRLLKQSYRLNAEATEPDPLLAADIQVQIGDFYTLNGRRRDAQRYYIRAWNTLEQFGNQEALLEEYFSVPINLADRTLPGVYPDNPKTITRFEKNPDTFLDGYVTAQYDIDASGRVRNIRIIESDPAGILDKRIRMMLSRRYYRPRIIDGIPVETKNKLIQHQFNYEVEPDNTDIEKDSSRIERPESNS